NLPTLYARNGPAVLACRAEVLFETNSFYGQRIVAFPMNETDSVDIDSPDDLELAAWLMTRRIT
ncbi:MAG: hypothetical protein ABI835_10545, partial [Chloroflexota bacterium]